MATRWRAELVQGMGKRGDGFVIILHIDKVFSWDSAPPSAATRALLAEPPAAHAVPAGVHG